ncbi:MAG: tandem-95 repeat protein [Bacteroidetes bacterium]|nr:tandem-95 repeat protein [Bacteroidota bacterium]
MMVPPIETIPEVVPIDSTITICPDRISDLPNPGDLIICDAGDLNATEIANGLCVDITGATVGNDTICVLVCDLDNPELCDTTIITITIIAPPVADNDTTTTNEDIPVTLDILANDVDPDGILSGDSITILTLPTFGTVVDNMDSTLTYTPTVNTNGLDSLQYEICDSGSPSLCDTAWVFITVDPSNDPPVANSDGTSTPEDTPVTVNVPQNDTDPDDGLDLTSVTIQTPPNNGGTSIDPVTGQITYTPDMGFNGLDTLIYEICDMGIPSPVLCDTALLVIDVGAVNDPPVAVDDDGTTPEDTAIYVDVQDNDSDPDGDPITTIEIVEGPIDGLVTIVDLDSILYSPNTNFNGMDSLTYSICDSGGLCDTAWVFITVDPSNDPPVAILDRDTMTEDTPVTMDVLSNDTDIDGNLDPSTVTVTDAPSNGTTSVNTTTGEITYTPDADFTGQDTLIYEVCDDGTPLPSQCDTAMVFLVIEPGVADLSLVKTVNDTTPIIGDTITFMLTLSNAGPDTATGVTVLDSLPSGYSYVSDDGASAGTTSEDGGILTWTIGSLEDGGNAMLLIRASVNGSGDYSNVAQVTASDQYDPDSEPNNDDGDQGEDDENKAVTVPELSCVTIEAYVYLEGSTIHSDGTENYAVPMRTDLNDLRLLPGQTLTEFFIGTQYTPAIQPYNQAPWNYAGDEGSDFDSGGDLAFAEANYPSTVTDWVLVSLRDSPEGTGEPICQTAALLHSDGHIQFVDAFECCNIDPTQDYYLVIEHRNHLIVMSHESLPVINGTITYDFRVQQSYIDDPYGFDTHVGQKEVLPGVYVMYGGNGDQSNTANSDTDINFDDRTYWEGQNSHIAKYRNGDYNMNGDTNYNDRRVWEINNGEFTSVPRD